MKARATMKNKLNVISSTQLVSKINNDKMFIETIPITDEQEHSAFVNLDGIIKDLNTEINFLIPDLDNLDYIVAIASGLISGLIDELFVGKFDLKRGEKIASAQVDNFVIKIAKLNGHKKEDIASAIKFLENKFPLPADANLNDFGGGRQHHLRDFAHHPNLVGLMFSLATQFTGKVFGTDTSGKFIICNLNEAGKQYIGNNYIDKIFLGTVKWFFHLVSDMAGSSFTRKIGRRGTGLPGPILSLAKELSALPFFKDKQINDTNITKLVSKLYNGTLFAQRDSDGKLILDSVNNFDLRMELGIGVEITRQALPVIVNEVVVRSFYMIRKLGIEIKRNNVTILRDFKKIKWNDIKPFESPNLNRMLLISTGVFTSFDVGMALAKGYWVSVNVIGVGRFAVAIGKDISWRLKINDLKKLKDMYQTIYRFTLLNKDIKEIELIAQTLGEDNFVLNKDQVEVLYSLERLKVLDDIDKTQGKNSNEIKKQKLEWLSKWEALISNNFSSFVNDADAKLTWYSKGELLTQIFDLDKKGLWIRYVLLEALAFEPYYALTTVTKKGKEIPDPKYNSIAKTYDYKQSDKFLREYSALFLEFEFIDNLRDQYNREMFELKEVRKGQRKILGLSVLSAIGIMFTVGAFAGPVAVALVGSKFATLNGAALTSASLAYLGGGALAAGGAGMSGGTTILVGGSSLLGFTVTASASGAAEYIGTINREATVQQSAKLLTSIKCIFAKDLENANYFEDLQTVFEETLINAEKQLIDIKSSKENNVKDRIKEQEESIRVLIKTNERITQYLENAVKTL